MKTFSQFIEESNQIQESRFSRIAAIASKRGKSFNKPGPRSGKSSPPLDIKMAGSPGSGKTTMATRLARATGGFRTGYDDAREKLYGNAAVQGDFNAVNRETMRSLAAADRTKPRILDNTNVNPMFAKSTNDSLKRAAGFGDDIVTISPRSSRRAMFRRNANRERNVPQFVMRIMATQFDNFRRTPEGREATKLGKELTKRFRLNRRTPNQGYLRRGKP